MNIEKRIERLRKLMKEKDIDAYIIPSSDSHQSEYTTEHFKSREWISGFTGSAGTVVVTKDKVALFTDGRYFLQAEKQLKNTEIELFKVGESGVLTLEQSLNEQLEDRQTLGFDGTLFSQLEVDKMKLELKDKEISLVTKFDLIDEIWTDRPKLSNKEIFIHDISFAGKSVREKLDMIRTKMKEKGTDYYLISCLDSIAWTFNIRGYDIPFNPVVISFAIIGKRDVRLFIDTEKLNTKSIEYLNANNIELCDYCYIENALKNIKPNKSIYFDLSKTSSWCFNNIAFSVKKILGEDIVESLKAIKNEVEIENFKNCQKRDGLAMVKFLYWIDKNIGNIEITELSASDKLEQFRSEGENYISLSFETIAGYKDHASVIHYSAKKETEYLFKDEGMLLLDSGAQYLDGTTDITRTIVMGKITDEEKRDFTLVLKGHIALSKAKFIYGTTGSELDILARMPLLEDGKNFRHGTGHGIGFLLSVHEGPQRISPVYNKIKLEDGMLVTNEPGFYKDGEYGIRTENIMLVRREFENEYGNFLKFETTTLCPIDLRAVEKELLNNEEIKWLNDYHKKVYESLFRDLDEKQQQWLKIHTREI